MKIFYWSNGWNNFGDELNPWLIPKALPGIAFDQDESEHFIGIGTLLNRRLSLPGRKYVIGAGVGYGEPPGIDDSYRIYGVRGPLSARALNLDEEKFALTDPAVLVPRLFAGAIEKTGRAAFMPHCHSESRADWAAVARSVGLDYISPTDDVDNVVGKIGGCKLLITEALHGAIVADAFRVPWIPVTASEKILEFKWQDWLASLQMRYEPHRIHGLVDGKGTTWLTRRKDEIKRVGLALGVNPSRWTPPAKPPTGNRELDEVRQTLRILAKGECVILSRDAAHLSAVGRVLGANERFQRDYLAG